MVHILPHRLPPHVDHGGQAGELLADFVEHFLFDRPPIALQELLERGDLGGPLRFNLLGTLGRRVRHPPGVSLYRHCPQVPPVRVPNLLPVRHVGFAGRHRCLGRFDLRLAGTRRLAFGQVLLSSTQRRRRGFPLTPYCQRIPLGQFMEEVKHLGDARALQPRFG